MLSEVNKELSQAQKNIARFHKIESMQKELLKEAEVLNGKERELKTILEKEKFDAKKLESKNIVSFFYSMLGNLEEHVEKERREAVAAKLKYDQVVRDLDYVNGQISQLASEHLSLSNCEKEYSRLYEEKKNHLIREAGETGKKIFDRTDSYNLSEAKLIELQEAVHSGNLVIDSLKQVYDSLFSAEGWGTFDLLGGGLISDMVKHSRIDDARSEVENTQRLMLQFKTELADIDLGTDLIAIDTDSFLYFADFVFDGFIADWLMQNKINESLDRVSEVTKQVAAVVDELTAMKSQETENIKLIEAEIESLVNEAH